jgi:xylulokinase
LAALGAGAIEKGTAVCSIGTVECITPIFDSVPDPALFKRHNLNIEHHVIPNRYVSFVYNQAGSLQKWFSRVFTDAEMASSTGPELYNRLASEMPKEPTNLLVLPFFEPTGAPLFMSDNYGCILGLTTATTRGEIFKAIVEGITYYFADALDDLSQMGLPIDSFVAVGGGARSDAWLQIQADILGRPIARSANVEAGTLGAAILAGTTTGVFKDTELAVQKFVKIERVFEPNKAYANAYQNSLGLYRSIYPELRGRLLKR